VWAALELASSRMVALAEQVIEGSHASPRVAVANDVGGASPAGIVWSVAGPPPRRRHPPPHRSISPVPGPTVRAIFGLVESSRPTEKAYKITIDRPHVDPLASVRSCRANRTYRRAQPSRCIRTSGHPRRRGRSGVTWDVDHGAIASRCRRRLAAETSVSGLCGSLMAQLSSIALVRHVLPWRTTWEEAWLQASFAPSPGDRADAARCRTVSISPVPAPRARRCSGCRELAIVAVGCSGPTNRKSPRPVAAARCGTVNCGALEASTSDRRNSSICERRA
jgi:hypothetical protein